MPNAAEIRVHGLRELNRAFSRADKKLKKDLTRTLKDVAEPVRAEAAQRTRNIRNIRTSDRGPDWSEMRTGVYPSVVYVAPQVRRRTVGPTRPKFGTLLMDRAMQPALDAHSSEVENELGRMLDHIANDWGRGG